MPPTAKAVLISLADNANDNGYCWPSLTFIAERTCFGRSAVIAAIKWLEEKGAVEADRSDRYRTTYMVTPHLFEGERLVREKHQSTKRTSPNNGELVHLPNNEVRQTNNEVRQVDTNHQEPSRTVRKATVRKERASAPTLPRPDGVTETTWADWHALRKAKRAPVTATVLAQAVEQAQLAGVPLERFLRIWCARGSQGLEAAWLRGNERAGPVKPNAAETGFSQKTYTGTSDDDLPEHLRFNH